MKKKLLKKVAKLVVLLPEDNFDMESWTENTSCGTTFCAVGAAAALGLVPNLSFCDSEFSSSKSLIFTENRKDFLNWKAVERAFDLSEEDAEYLFSADAYPDGLSRKAVAKRIKKYIKENS